MIFAPTHFTYINLNWRAIENESIIMIHDQE